MRAKRYWAVNPPSMTRVAPTTPLASSLAINPNTIQRAYAELEAEGYIYSVAGRGSFVSAGDGEHLRRIAELTGRLVPLLEELKSLGYTREQLLVLWEGGEGK